MWMQERGLERVVFLELLDGFRFEKLSLMVQKTREILMEKEFLRNRTDREFDYSQREIEGLEPCLGSNDDFNRSSFLHH